jgi:hypothetical protein
MCFVLNDVLLISTISGLYYVYFDEKKLGLSKSHNNRDNDYDDSENNENSSTLSKNQIIDYLTTKSEKLATLFYINFVSFI